MCNNNAFVYTEYICTFKQVHFIPLPPHQALPQSISSIWLCNWDSSVRRMQRFLSTSTKPGFMVHYNMIWIHAPTPENTSDHQDYYILAQ